MTTPKCQDVQSEATSTTQMTMPYPEIIGKPFGCPVCSISFRLFTSFTRHAANKHPGQVQFLFECALCKQSYATKRSVSIHHAKMHSAQRETIDRICSRNQTSSPNSSFEGLRCPYCEDVVPSKRSLGQHIRNQHAAEASYDRDHDAQTIRPTREWSLDEHARFIDALEKFGPSSNIAISNAVQTKTCKQVGVHKRIFLRNNPDWISNHPPPTTKPQSNALTEVVTPPPVPAEEVSTETANPSAEAVNSPPTPLPEQASPPCHTSVGVGEPSVSCSMSEPSVCPVSPPHSPCTPSPPKHVHLTPHSCAHNHLIPLSDLSVAAGSSNPTVTSPSLPELTIPSALTMPKDLPIDPTSPPTAIPLTQSDAVTTPLQQNSNNTGPPADQSGTQEVAGEKLKQLRTVRMDQFVQTFGHLLERQLSGDQWDQFVTATDTLVEDLEKIKVWAPARHPTSHWKRRQQGKSKQCSGNLTPPQGRHALSSNTTTTTTTATTATTTTATTTTTEDKDQTRPTTIATAPGNKTRTRSHRRREAAKAKKVQAWYRANKKRCMRSLLDEESETCRIDTKTLEEYFDVPSVGLTGDTPSWLPPEHAPSSTNLTHQFHPAEIEAQLKRLPWQSSPGPDKVPYRLWKSIPASADLLSKLYNTCLLSNRLPPSWKRSTTILIYKKGDESLPGNWRPISLQTAIYKIFAAAMAKRLASWALAGKKLSSCQKGFLPMEGCAEHCFLMESLLCDAKRRKKDLRIMWLDLKNAFGSVSHELLWLMMQRLGVPTPFIHICQEIYAGSSQQIRCAAGFTRDLPLRVGIKQGCPLSPLLFNIALEALLPALDKVGLGYSFANGSTIKQLAYADDRCLTETSKQAVSTSLQLVHEFSVWSGLHLNVSKCGCLSMINSRGRYVESFSPAYGTDSIPALKWEDTYRYLGVEIGRPRKGTVDPVMAKVVETVERIVKSKLTDWQKVDAINTFAMSKLTYHLNSSCLNRSWAAKLDATIRRQVKKAVKLPVRTTSSFLHLPSHSGGMGLCSAEDRLESAMVTRSLKCLVSKDRLVSDLAWDQLAATITKRTGSPPRDVTEVLSFLHSPGPKGEYAKGDVRSMWSMVRKSLKHLSCTISHIEGEYWISFADHTAKAGKWKEVGAVLKTARDDRRLKMLLECTDQGRSFHLLAKSDASNHWITTGKYTSFAAYRFATKARLNLFPVKTVVRRAGKALDTTCPRCRAQPESLGHVLNACTPNAGLMRERHNTILQRLVKAANKEDKDLFVEQSFSPDALRPDIVLHNRLTKDAFIVDVTVPYESGPDAFSKARSEKEQKYAGLKAWMEAQGNYNLVQVHAFIAGSLGAWDSNNSPALRALGIGHNYSKLFSKQCSADAIHGSLAIWISSRR